MKYLLVVIFCFSCLVSEVSAKAAFKAGGWIEEKPTEPAAEHSSSVEESKSANTDLGSVEESRANAGRASAADPSKIVEWVDFTVADTLFSVSYPKIWEVSLQQSIVSLMATNSAGAVTIFAQRMDHLPLDFTEGWLPRTFENRQPTSALHKVSNGNWSGFRQEYRFEEDGLTRDWIAIAAQRGKTYVLITANDTIENMKVMKEIYVRILNSLEILEASPEQ